MKIDTPLDFGKHIGKTIKEIYSGSLPLSKEFLKTLVSEIINYGFNLSKKNLVDDIKPTLELSIKDTIIGINITPCKEAELNETVNLILNLLNSPWYPAYYFENAPSSYKEYWKQIPSPSYINFLLRHSNKLWYISEQSIKEFETIEVTILKNFTARKIENNLIYFEPNYEVVLLKIAEDAKEKNKQKVMYWKKRSLSPALKLNGNIVSILESSYNLIFENNKVKSQERIFGKSFKMIFDDYNNLKAQIGYKGESDSIFYHYNEKFELIKTVRVQFPSHERKLTNFKYYSNEGNQILSRTSTESSEISTVESNYFYTKDNILKEIRSNEIIFDFDDGANVSDMGKNYDDYDAWANIGASDGGSTWISFYDARGNIVESRYYCDPHSSFTKMKYDANELLTELNKDGYIQTFKYILDEKNNWVRRVTFSNSIATQFTIRKISYK